MTFTEQMQSTAMNAQLSIKEILDNTHNILLYTPLLKEGEEGFDPDIDELDYPQDEYEDCITHEYQGKHGHMYQYFLIRVYKAEERYYAIGLDQDDMEDRQFELIELDSWTTAAIADYLIENKL